MLNLMLSGIAPRKAGAKLRHFYKTTKFFNVFYQFIYKFLDFHAFILLIITALRTKTAISFALMKSEAPMDWPLPCRFYFT